MTRAYHYFAYGSNLLPQRLAARVTIGADLGRRGLRPSPGCGIPMPNAQQSRIA
jgi:hypothetical protein